METFIKYAEVIMSLMIYILFAFIFNDSLWIFRDWISLLFYIIFGGIFVCLVGLGKSIFN